VEIPSSMSRLPIAPRSSPQALKAVAQEFEGLLLATLLKDFKLGAGALPGQDCLGVSAYGDFATEALASGLAKAGGIGFGSLLVTALGKPR